MFHEKCFFGGSWGGCELYISLSFQVPNSYILTQNLYYNDYYPKPTRPIIGYLDPLGIYSLLKEQRKFLSVCKT